MREGYTSQAKKALAYAVRTAEKCGHNYVGTEHLLIGLLNVEDGTAGMVLSEFHVDAGQLTELIDRLIAPGGNTVTESRPGYTPRVRRVLENAEAEAARFKSRAVGTEHLLIAILKESDCVATRLLFTMGINIQKLYGDTLKTSVSRLEQYRSCPFSYYLKYGLNLSERQEFKVQALDTGSFMHDVIDSFFDKLQERDIKIKGLEQEDIDKIVDEIINEKLSLKKNYIFTSIPKYIVLANRLRKVIKKSMKYIIDSLKYSDFEVMGHEMEFKNGKEYPAIQISLDNGKRVEVTGKIDRIDIAKAPDGNYIRIIDYKSSAKDINLNEVVAGLQIQLLTYLDAVCSIEDLIPAGAFYFNLIDPSIKATKQLDEQKIEDEIRKQFKMKGLILADVDIVKKMDKTLETGNSNIVPAYINKDGNLANRASTITRQQFENLQKYTNKIIKQISNEILTGDISVKPYYKLKQGKTPCEYCKYKSICNFNTGICKREFRFVGNEGKEQILEEIGK